MQYTAGPDLENLALIPWGSMSKTNIEAKVQPLLKRGQRVFVFEQDGKDPIIHGFAKDDMKLNFFLRKESFGNGPGQWKEIAGAQAEIPGQLKRS